MFEDESSGDDLADELASIKEELVATRAERDFFQKEMLKLAKKSASDNSPVTLEGVKQLIQNAVKAGSAANTPKKLQRAETDGVFARVDMTDDAYHCPEGTIALLDLLKTKLQAAKEARDFGLGINIEATLHASCQKLGKAVAKHHFQLPTESTALFELRQEFFPTESCKVPSTIMPLFFRALSSRNITVKWEEIGVDQDGNPVPLLAK